MMLKGLKDEENEIELRKRSIAWMKAYVKEKTKIEDVDIYFNGEDIYLDKAKCQQFGII